MARTKAPAAKKSPRRSVPQAKPTRSLRLRLVSTWQRVSVRTPGSPHHAFRLTRARLQRVSAADLRAVWRLQVESWSFILRHKQILLGLGALYAVLGYVLIGGISQLDYVAFKDATMQVVNGDVGALGMAFSLFGAALTGNLSASPGELQQFMAATLLLFFWLAIVWAARMLGADKEIRLRDALYNSGTPIVPTLVVLAVVALQLLPATVGIFAYATALNGGWLTGGVESMTFAVAAASLTLLSAYLVVSSLTALIVVALPGTYPWQALRTARGMVMNHRWSLVLRVLVLAVHAVLLWGVVLIPVFLLDGWLRADWLPLVPIVVQALIGLTLVYSSVYIYRLYRSLL